jgi:hypothetical protein
MATPPKARVVQAWPIAVKVVDERQAAKYEEFEHCVIDTEARPEEEDLSAGDIRPANHSDHQMRWRWMP